MGQLPETNPTILASDNNNNLVDVTGLEVNKSRVARAETPAGFPVFSNKGIQVFKRSNDPLASPYATPALGTGTGSDVIITFTQQDLMPNFQPGARPDEALLHELTHALQMMSGRMTKRYLPPRDFPPALHLQGRLQFGNISDLLAVTIANIYRSEQRNRPALRADHRGLLPLSPSVDSEQFYLMFRNEFDELHGFLPFLFVHVAQVECGFNPIRSQMKLGLNISRNSDFAAYESMMNRLEANAPPGSV
jgi:hypothetical protein